MYDNFYSLGKGYLYTPWNGKIKELKGEIKHRDEVRIINRIDPERTYFEAVDKHNRVIKKLVCSSVEGEVYNKVVWLFESDIRKAAEILIQYEEEQISILKFKIEMHETLIETLKEQIEKGP